MELLRWLNETCIRKASAQCLVPGNAVIFVPCHRYSHCHHCYFSHGSHHCRILSYLSRFIVSHYPSVSLTHLRPAVCSSPKRPWMLMIATFIFLAQNFPWVWYPLGNRVGISNVVLAIGLKYGYLFLSPNLLPPPTPKPGVFADFFSLSKWQHSVRNLSYLSRFVSFLSNPFHPHILLFLQNLSWANPPLLVFIATS